ncbi:MdtA/MuxA family multidrug efflux RND transporter periplasmic adaptor subunit [Pseudomonas mangiferae]|uniref:MdtA/MuxA family multidrug efflux RND transporter periplasmic adaptor subunit n=1 Tax=Pseudomonas mangiferae TaxID=2593654 RepID=A0A553GVG4_9PSED|nr:MdtA/MuxA family multidrug efflux RND transporter periplasmic adaptor subunit [Pseudomonas mangiferae]TRX73518.1 MdtA/MuxA family multidrug efflux RND transporter periplasmic adaptor subunit [Pseudomonas mangiferae]
MSDSSPRSSRLSRRWLLIVVLLVLAVALAWWFWPHPKEKTAGPSGRAGFGNFGGAVPVRVAPATQGDFPVYYKALGTVTALNTVNVRSRVAGELVKVLFEEGQRVKAGDLLAVIDPRPYEVALQQAEGTLAQNQAQLKNAEIDLARYKGLYAEDSIAKQTLDTQEALLRQYQGTLKANQASVADARLNLQYSQIRAPIAGRLGLRQLDQGNLVAANDSTALVVITQTQPISVAFTLPEGDLPAVLERVRSGDSLVVEAWDRGDRKQVASGVLQSLDNQIDTSTGTLKFKARFENQDEALFPNQFVNIHLRADVLADAIRIPSAAVQVGARGTFVYVVGADNKVQLRTLETGPSDGENTVVRSGLQAGERVVMEGTDRLREGAEVEVVEGVSAPPAAAPVDETQQHVPRRRGGLGG